MDKNIIMTMCLTLGILCWVVAGFFAIRKRNDLKSVVRFIGLGVFISLFFFIYPYAMVQSGLFALPLALLQVMASAVVASDPLGIFEVLSLSYTVPYLDFYQAILIVLHVIAPMFTIGITLSFFENKFSVLFYRIRSSGRESHIFSDVNLRTLSLAESIFYSGSKCALVFTADIESLEEQRDFLDRIKNIGGFILDRDPYEIKHNLKHTRTFYLLKPDSGRNLKDAIHLFEKYDDVGGDIIKIWLYSKDEISSIVFDNIDEKIDIRLVNEEQLISGGLMRKYPLYTAICDGRLDFMLLGAGNIGLEILRTALWCSRLSDRASSRFYVLDRNAELVKHKLNKQCPGILEKFDISFESIDIETDSLNIALAKANPTYVVVALGEEQRNLRIGTALRRFYGNEPKIHVLTDSEETECMVIDNLKISDWNFDRQQGVFNKREVSSFELLPFGSYKETYSNMRFSKSYYDFLAMAINAVRFGIFYVDNIHNVEYLRDLLNKVEFYKNYSYAYATNIPYKLWLMGLQLEADGKGDLSLLDDALEANEKLLISQESERWSCYMMTEGWQIMPLGDVHDGIYQDKMRKRHARLAPENTEELSRMLGRDFAAEDRANLYLIPKILKLANSLTDIPYSVVPYTDKG